jgi:ATP-binding cassette subfamily B protein
MLFAAASTIFNIIGPKILGKATTRLYLKGYGADFRDRHRIDFPYIGNILITIGILYLLSSLFTYIQGWVMSDVSAKMTYRFRKEIAAKINRIPLKYFDGTSHGEVLSRVTNDVDTVSQHSTRA